MASPKELRYFLVVERTDEDNNVVDGHVLGDWETQEEAEEAAYHVLDERTRFSSDAGEQGLWTAGVNSGYYERLQHGSEHMPHGEPAPGSTWAEYVARNDLEISYVDYELNVLVQPVPLAHVGGRDPERARRQPVETEQRPHGSVVSPQPTTVPAVVVRRPTPAQALVRRSDPERFDLIEVPPPLRGRLRPETTILLTVDAAGDILDWRPTLRRSA